MRGGNRTRHTRSFERLYLSSYRIIELLAKPFCIVFKNKTGSGLSLGIGCQVFDLIKRPVSHKALVRKTVPADQVVHLWGRFLWLRIIHGLHFMALSETG